MIKVDVSTIKGNVIKDELPEIMESINTSITDDSQSVLEAAVKELSRCNKKLGKTLKQLNTYMDSMADAFSDSDRKAGEAFKGMSGQPANNAGKIKPGTKGYLELMS